MQEPCFLNLEEARQVLAEMGINFTLRQIKRASEKDANGRRKLPFFVDPIDGKLKIEKKILTGIYSNLQNQAMRNIRNEFNKN